MNQETEIMGFNSARYWEQRYADGKNSGDGSYIEALRTFKNGWIEQVIRWKKITSIIDWGCGDGHQLVDLKFKGKYIGVDVSRTAIEKCRELYKDRPNFEFFTAYDFIEEKGKMSKMGLSLDVIYHLVEDQVFDDYMCNLFDCSQKFVLIYSSNGGKVENPAAHLKDRCFTEWIEKNRPEWELITMLPNSFPYRGGKSKLESISDFYLYGKKRLKK